MAEQNNYITVLIESLQTKLQVLDKIIERNQAQTVIAEEEKFDMEAFDNNMTQKSELITRLGLLDDGFETVYERVKPELLQHKDKYKEEIKQMQSLISEITDKSIAIQAAETKNRQLIEKHFRFARQELQHARTTTKAASNYYKAMSRVNTVDPQMMDQKK